MVKRDRVSQKDVEKISAYIDGELSDREQAILEARFKLEPELQASRDELLQIRKVMRTLPEVRLPRSFTLSPEIVRSKTEPFSFPKLQLATALAAIALVLLVGLDFLSGQTALTRRAAPAAVMEMQAESVPQVELEQQDADAAQDKSTGEEREAPAAESGLTFEEGAAAEAPEGPAAAPREESGFAAGEPVDEEGEPAADLVEEEVVQLSPFLGENERSGLDAGAEPGLESSTSVQADTSQAAQPLSTMVRILSMLLPFRFLIRAFSFITALGLLILVVTLVRSRRSLP